MKEKFVSILEVRGIMAEMGMTPVTSKHVLHVQGDDVARDFWFIETEDDINDKITNFIRWNINEYMFAYVKDNDYENGKYAVGNIEDLKDYRNPEGIHEDNEFMNLSFAEMIEKIRV